jgi:transposase InsO family protein
MDIVGGFALADGSSAKVLIGIEYLLTQSRSPTTTSKIERLHRSRRGEFLCRHVAFTNPNSAQQAIDESVQFYDSERPHQGAVVEQTHSKSE